MLLKPPKTMNEIVSETIGPFIGSDFTDGEFDEVRRVLLAEREFDLGMYKDRCIKRRIATRVRALGFTSAESYIELLKENPDEVEALMRALSVHVSHFFRNPSTFEALQKRIFPELFTRLSAKREPVRIWSAGCATGEEPYSLALLLDRDFPDSDFSILGTDLSPAAVEQATSATFPENRLDEVSPELLQRSFRKEGRSYLLAKEIRSHVTFKVHDILSLSDYPACDLILCRNVLIYFAREDQERIMDRFHSALNPGGYLVLGKAETLQGRARKSFMSECPIERIYRRK